MMEPAEQDEIIDSQVAPSNPAEPGDAGTENNDENNNLVSDNGEVLAAEESSEPADGIGDEAAGDAPVQSDDTVDNNVTETLEKEADEGQREDVDMEEGKEETPPDDQQKEEEGGDTEEATGPTEPDRDVADTEEQARTEGSPPPPQNQDEGKETAEPEQAEQEVTAGDGTDVKSEAGSNDGEESLVPTPTPATKIRLNTRKHTTTPADDSGLVQPVLPKINKGQANVQQMTTSITHARRKQDGLVPISRQPVRSRVPPKLVRLATVTVSPAKSRPPRTKTASLYYEEPRRPAKVITWDQATNHRPPLRIDMEGPGPCSYSPLNKPLGETNAPCFTFGTKCYSEKDGGARTSWGKSWFQSHHLWHSKADYSREGLWPSPNHYPKPALLGPRQRTMTEAPSYTFGHKQAFSIVKPCAAKEPSPNDYERQNADSLVLRRGPSFTHQFRREGTVLWGYSEKTPAPCSYATDRSPRVHRPAYTIQGIRREKSHVLGPYSTL